MVSEGTKKKGNKRERKIKKKREVRVVLISNGTKKGMQEMKGERGKGNREPEPGRGEKRRNNRFRRKGER